MTEYSELITLALGAGVGVILLTQQEQLRRLRGWRILTAAYGLMLAGWVLALLKGLFLQKPLTFAEHVCYAAGAVTAMIWTFHVFFSGKEKGHAAGRSN